MQKEAESLFNGFPIFAFAGKANPEADVIRMNGFAVKQGVAK